MKRRTHKLITPVEDPHMSTVIYVIDVPGSDPKQAATIAADIMAESATTGAFHVLNIAAGVFEVDLQDGSVRNVSKLPEAE